MRSPAPKLLYRDESAGELEAIGSCSEGVCETGEGITGGGGGTGT